MRSLRTIFNLAIRRDLIKQNIYLFHKYKISKLKGKGIKYALNLAEIELFKNVDCEGDIQLINEKITSYIAFIQES